LNPEDFIAGQFAESPSRDSALTRVAGAQDYEIRV
jgi:hypothetical protein